MLDFILLALGLGFFAHPAPTRAVANASHVPTLSSWQAQTLPVREEQAECGVMPPSRRARNMQAHISQLYCHICRRAGNHMEFICSTL
jgi:hypothetical protein